MEASDILDLFSGNPAQAQTSASALAQAIRQRRAAATLGAITGDSAMGAVGKEIGGQADKLEAGLMSAAQHRADQDIQRQHFDALAKYQAGLLGARQQDADTHAALVALKEGETMVTHDMWGNPITVRKYPGGRIGPVSPSGAGGIVAPASAPARPGPLKSPAAPPAPGAAPGSAPAPAAAGGVPPPVLPPGAGLTPEAFDQAAEKAYRTGKFESYGRATAAMKNALQTRISQLHPGEDLASVAGSFGADKRSLDQQTRLLDLTKSWEATGKANLGVLRDLSKQLANAGSPLLNRPLRWAMQNAAGDPVVAKFKAAHAAVVNEYAKILSGNTGSGGVTEGARHEAEDMFPLDATPQQMAAAADLLETDAGNRLAALERQWGATKERMGSKATPGGAHEAAPAPAAPDAAAALRKKYGL